MAMSPRLLRPRAAGGFNPKTVGTLAVWLNPADTSTLTYNSSTISQINDASGNGRHFVQATAASQPGTTTLNGRNALLFDGKWMRQTALSAYANRTVIIVVRRDTGTNPSAFGAVFGYRSSASAISGVSNSDAAFGFRADSASSGTPTGFDTNGLATVAAWSNGASATLQAGASVTQRFATCPLSTAGSAVIVSINTTQTASGNKMPLLGVEGNSSTRTYLMTLCEVLIYSDELGTTARRAVEAYLSKKWGVTVA
jgi:hypothetical protein